MSCSNDSERGNTKQVARTADAAAGACFSEENVRAPTRIIDERDIVFTNLLSPKRLFHADRELRTSRDTIASRRAANFEARRVRVPSFYDIYTCA